MPHAHPPLPQPDSAEPLSPRDFARWYGPWEPLTPATIADFLDGFDRPWWIVGGWALEKATGVSRAHEDMDVSVAHSDAEALRIFLRDRGWTTWNADSGWLRPFDDRFREIRSDSGIWVRADATSPWVLDIPLTPFRGGRWTNKRLPEQEHDLDEVTWIGEDGLRYLNPEIVLFMKMWQSRAKDVLDAERTLHLLSAPQKHWLAAAVGAVDPEHPWAEVSPAAP
ncbi:nucleotidyltransferase domain-containing protein [Microbacterium sp. NPDC012755]|uniref:nucleotidyltransferase domain-containing protein n=1 Tax=Microbacterium sp. NPDC012755 TaxID=3364184 RepID=UPI0036750F93